MSGVSSDAFYPLRERSGAGQIATRKKLKNSANFLAALFVSNNNAVRVPRMQAARLQPLAVYPRRERSFIFGQALQWPRNRGSNGHGLESQE
jgi:hypothetical protein